MAQEAVVLQELARNPISRAGRFSSNSTDYGAVVSWTVLEGAKGRLDEISLVHDTPANTQFKLTINGKVQWEDRYFQSALTIPFREDNDLPEKAQVLLEARSDNGAVTVTVDGHISGVEVQTVVMVAEAMGLPWETVARRYGTQPGLPREALRVRFPPLS